MKSFYFFFLFSETLSLERIELFSLLLHSSQISLSIGITGDALYSLNDSRFTIYWKKIINSQKCNIILDQWEAEIRGLTLNSLTTNLSEDCRAYIQFSSRSPTGFWEALINHEMENNSLINYLGFLQMKGPYMDRSSVYALRFLEASLNKNIHAQLFCYLDGVHVGHVNQSPSEFENIGEKLTSITQQSSESGLIMETLACSRCGIARGYGDNQIHINSSTSPTIIPGFKLCNLDEIIDKFEKDVPIYSSNGGVWYNFDTKAESPPKILLFISHTPYQEEYTFGGLSFAMACANHGIQVSVIFIEDGVYTLYGQHQIHSNDHIFNMQEIIYVTYEMENIDYYVYLPSLTIRNISINGLLDYITPLSSKSLSVLMTNLIESENSNMGRIIFF